jgi:ferritin-like metal-binding protein YciE
MSLNSLQDLLVEEMKDLYSAEQQIIKALPKMASACNSQELRRAFESHLKQTEEHVSRLETCFEVLGESPKGKFCKGMEGLLKEGEEFIQEAPPPEVMDAGLISAAQRVEHYEMAAYGCCRTYAEELGIEDVAKLLQKTLDEEGETDKKLTRLAEQRGINRKAEKAA